MDKTRHTPKRLFGPAYFAANGALLVTTLALRTATPHPRLAASGALLVHGAPLAFLASLYVLRRGRTSEQLPGLRAPVAAGTLLSALAGPPWRGVASAVAGVGGTELYLRWYSRFGRAPSPVLVVGQQLPDDLAFVGEAGRPVTAAELRGRPTALLFYRGNWCPLCVAQIGELAERWRELEALGVEVALVSPQDEAHTQALAKRFGVAFTYLRDPDLSAAARLGLVDHGGVPPGIPGYEPDTVLPTVVVLDASGTIVFCDQTDNYRVRPEPNTILAALRTAGALR